MIHRVDCDLISIDRVSTLLGWSRAEHIARPDHGRHRGELVADAYCWKMRPPALTVIVNVSQISLLLFVVSVNTNNNKGALTF